MGKIVRLSRSGLAVTLAAVFVALQLVRPGLARAPARTELAAPPAVRDVLRDSCYDCHSSETRRSWFDQVVPAYWLVARDVERARAHLSLSALAERPVLEQRDRLFEAVNHVRLGAMPPRRYTLLHPEARVTPAELATLERYLATVAAGSSTSPVRREAAREEYEAWVAAPAHRPDVRPAPNGVRLPRGYREWKVVSMTDRFDSGSLRVVLGNEMAIRAIAAGHTNPWPDGSILAKVEWDQLGGTGGDVDGGAFQRAEFMIKDRHRYATTGGWGWGRWQGGGLEPQGAGPGFATGCVSCHAPVKDRDLVFTIPLARQAGGAPVPGLPIDPFQWKAIAAGLDERDSTMSTLYGNDAAVRAARTDSGYGPGAALAMATWRRREDPYWFGARIPGALVSVELVTVGETEDHRPTYGYEEYRGAPLRKVAEREPGAERPARLDAILGRRALVMP